MAIMAPARTKTQFCTGLQAVLFIVLVILASPASGKMSDAAENFETKGSEVPQCAGKASSWVDWAYGKLQKVLWWKPDNTRMAAKNIQDNAGDIAAKTKDKVLDYSSGTANHASEKTTEAQNAMADSSDDATASMGDKDFHAKDTITNRAGDAADKAFDEARQKASEAYESAKESMSTGAKRAYEASKEKVSKATGDLGAAMTPDEL